MTTNTLARAQTQVRATSATHSLGFDWLMTLLSVWFVGGLFVDGWAHTHDQVDQSFFTPWHAILYSGWMVVAFFLVTHALVRRAHGNTWRTALPQGYFPSLIGAVGFGIGGLGDMAWHIAFGIEKGTEALLSPTHLVLAVSMGLIASGPLRAQIKESRAGFVQQLPAVVSLALTLSVVTFFTQATHPVAQLWGTRNWHNYQSDDFAATALLLGGATFAAATLFALKLGKPVPGAFTLIFGLNAFAMGYVNGDSYPQTAVWAFVIGGLVLDVACAALTRVRPSTRASVLAALTPAVLLGAYFVSVHFLLSGLAWRIHFWMGILVMTALGGLLLSKLNNRPE